MCRSGNRLTDLEQQLWIRGSPQHSGRLAVHRHRHDRSTCGRPRHPDPLTWATRCADHATFTIGSGTDRWARLYRAEASSHALTCRSMWRWVEGRSGAEASSVNLQERHVTTSLAIWVVDELPAADAVATICAISTRVRVPAERPWHTSSHHTVVTAMRHPSSCEPDSSKQRRAPSSRTPGVRCSLTGGEEMLTLLGGVVDGSGRKSGYRAQRRATDGPAPCHVLVISDVVSRSSSDAACRVPPRLPTRTDVRALTGRRQPSLSRARCHGWPWSMGTARGCAQPGAGQHPSPSRERRPRW